MYEDDVNSSASDQTILTHSVIAQYMRLEHNGHLRVFEWSEYNWKEVGDLLTLPFNLGKCLCPMICGEYRIRTTGECSCPESNNFR